MAAPEKFYEKLVRHGTPVEKHWSRCLEKNNGWNSSLTSTVIFADSFIASSNCGSDRSAMPWPIRRTPSFSNANLGKVLPLIALIILHKWRHRGWTGSMFFVVGRTGLQKLSKIVWHHLWTTHLKKAYCLLVRYLFIFDWFGAS